MLRIYQMPNGHLYQYEEGTQPEGAVLFEKQAETKNKAVKPANKTRKAAKK